MDEVDSLPLPVQAKLLRFLETGEIQPVGDTQDGAVGEFIRDHREDDPLRAVNQQTLGTLISRALEGLSYREREIIRLRFGLVDGYTYTLEEVGSLFDVTTSGKRVIFRFTACLRIRVSTPYIAAK
jgi:DNA-directed RNA polymerase specialized sigma subunit